MQDPAAVQLMIPLKEVYPGRAFKQRTRKNDEKWMHEKGGGEECPGVLRQPFVLVRPISVGFAYMNATLIG